MQDDETDAGGELLSRPARAFQVLAEQVDRVGVRRAEADRAAVQRHAVIEAEDALRVDAGGDHLRRRPVGDDDGDVAEAVEQLPGELGERRLGHGGELVLGEPRRARRLPGEATRARRPA